MEEHNTALINNVGERVTSIYADTYFNDDYCDYQLPDEEETEASLSTSSNTYEWQSPSDLLIGVVELVPPFTSKITRGITHQGILAIGNEILERERARFNKYIEKLIHEHEIVWNQILEAQKVAVQQKVKEIYSEILLNKSKALMKEIHVFYESTLQELEDHMRREVSNVLRSTRASIISDLNTEIKQKLQKEKKILEKVLQNKYESEVTKIKHYYRLLLDGEESKYNKTINQAIHARNDALTAFYRQIEATTLTSTMYVMCTERKKCRIKQFLLEKFHTAEVAEKLKRIKEQEDILESYKAKNKHLTELNKEWEEKIKKILALFLKFISFSLKLLPEQTTFLLDLEKMVVLQLNEMQKEPTSRSSILIDEENLSSYKFIKPDEEGPVCDKDPFVIEGDTADSIPTPHGSRETLASNVALPALRLQRQFIYAKCDKFEDVKAVLEAKRCKCRDYVIPASPPPVEPPPVVSEPSTPETISSLEHLRMDDNIEILQDCPVRKCQNWAKDFYFPYMLNYLDFNEENYRRIKGIFGNPIEKATEKAFVEAKLFIYQELPFGETHEKTHTVGTQYSSPEDLSKISLVCRCTEEATAKIRNENSEDDISNDKQIQKILAKRKTSLNRMIHKNPNLLKMFTDEDMDFVYTIK